MDILDIPTQIEINDYIKLLINLNYFSSYAQWTDSTGTKWTVFEMSNKHLQNAIKYAKHTGNPEFNEILEQMEKELNCRIALRITK